MPEQREENGQQGKKGADGSKKHADFGGLVLGDQVSRELLKHVVKLAGALGHRQENAKEEPSDCSTNGTRPGDEEQQTGGRQATAAARWRMRG